MARARVDNITMLSAEEYLGAFTKVVRRARVVGCVTKGYNILNEALNATDMPQYGHGLVGVNGADSSMAHLRCAGRSPKIIANNAVEVDLTYESLLADANQNLDNTVLPDGQKNIFAIIYGTHKTSLVQKKTNFYRENGVGPRIQLFVSHTFPRGNGEEQAGVLKNQGGEIDIHEPQSNYKFAGVVNTPYPWLLEDALIGSVNSTAWMNRVPFTWMCTEVSYRMLRLYRYRFEFEFQSNEDLWQPEIVFIDERTGRVPERLVDGVGKKKIPYYRPRNFNLAFGSMFEGWAGI
jgi:hypothetical protein